MEAVSNGGSTPVSDDIPSGRIEIPVSHSNNLFSGTCRSLLCVFTNSRPDVTKSPTKIVYRSAYLTCLIVSLMVITPEDDVELDVRGIGTQHAWVRRGCLFPDPPHSLYPHPLPNRSFFSPLIRTTIMFTLVPGHSFALLFYPFK
jgi:hypothetical protein